MTNIPNRVGGRYLCFVVEKADRGWGGPWGHECGHAPCAYCGKPLLRRKDGTPRQHSVRQCPAKDQGYRIEREFARHIERREYQ